MINGNFPSRYVNGTSALKVTDWENSAYGASVIPFPACRPTSLKRTSKSLKARMQEILAASEMYCSLMLEDFRGCPYNVFTRKGISVLAISISALAIASIIAGA